MKKQILGLSAAAMLFAQSVKAHFPVSPKVDEKTIVTSNNLLDFIGNKNNIDTFNLVLDASSSEEAPEKIDSLGLGDILMDAKFLIKRDIANQITYDGDADHAMFISLIRTAKWNTQDIDVVCENIMKRAYGFDVNKLPLQINQWHMMVIVEVNENNENSRNLVLTTSSWDQASTYVYIYNPEASDMNQELIITKGLETATFKKNNGVESFSFDTDSATVTDESDVLKKMQELRDWYVSPTLDVSTVEQYNIDEPVVTEPILVDPSIDTTSNNVDSVASPDVETDIDSSAIQTDTVWTTLRWVVNDSMTVQEDINLSINQLDYSSVQKVFAIVPEIMKWQSNSEIDADAEYSEANLAVLRTLDLSGTDRKGFTKSLIDVMKKINLDEMVDWSLHESRATDNAHLSFYMSNSKPLKIDITLSSWDFENNNSLMHFDLSLNDKDSISTINVRATSSDEKQSVTFHELGNEGKENFYADWVTEGILKDHDGENIYLKDFDKEEAFKLRTAALKSLNSIMKQLKFD